jgi:Cys-tRNA(Pro)/Cys-tRNA(Cys) deacylase
VTPAIRALEQAGVPHEVLSYEAAAAGRVGVEAARSLNLDPAQVFKTLVVMLDDEQPAIAMVPVAAELDLKRLAATAGARRARLADRARAERLTGYVTGGISPLAQRRPLPTYLASEATALERIYVSAGRRGLELGLACRDLRRLTGAKVCELTR